MRGDRLKELREEAHLTQEELSLQLSISEPQIWRYENGESSPKADVLVRLSAFFNVSVDYLLGVSDDPSIHVGGDLSTKESAVIAAWRRGERFEAIKVIAGDE